MRKLMQSIRLNPARTMVAVAVFTAGFLNLRLNFEDQVSVGDISLPTLAVASEASACEAIRCVGNSYIVTYYTLCNWQCSLGGTGCCPTKTM